MTTTETTSITVMTWNLWAHVGPWAARATAIQATLAQIKPDVIAVQEAWCSNGDDTQVADLAEQLGYHYVAHHHPAAPHRGLGLLALWPLCQLAVIPLPSGDAAPEHRAALAAEIHAPVGPRAFYVTHLNWRRDHGHIRREQLATITRHITDHTNDAARAVLCGDLNAEPESDEVRMVTGLAPPSNGVVFEDAWSAANTTADPGFTWTHRNPHAAAERLGNARLDYVFVRWKPSGRGAVLHAEVIDGHHNGVWGSDHSALVARLDLS